MFRVITVFESSYNEIIEIAEAQDLMNDKGQPSPRLVVEHLLKNFKDKIA